MKVPEVRSVSGHREGSLWKDTDTTPCSWSSQAGKAIIPERQDKCLPATEVLDFNQKERNGKKITVAKMMRMIIVITGSQHLLNTYY